VSSGPAPPERQVSLQKLSGLILNPIQSMIGARLAFSFMTIVLLMAAGYAIAVWEFRQLLLQEQHLDRVQQESGAVLDLHSHLFAFRDQIEDLSDTHDERQFLRETNRIRKSVLEDIEKAKRTFAGQSRQNDRDSFVIVSLEAIEVAMPTQIDALADLAKARDWAGIRLRSQHQVRQLSYLTASLVDRVAAEVNDERVRVASGAERAKMWAIVSLVGIGGSTLLIAAALGSWVTRSITRPLAMLRSGTQALAKGDFQYQVETAGKDELADLGNAFNYAARQLRKLYGNLEESEARFRSLIEHSSDFIVVLDRECNIVYVSPSSERVFRTSAGDLLGKNISELIQGDAFQARLLMPAEADRASQTFEFRYRHPDGAARMIETVSTNLLDDPNVRGIVLNARDITERRRAEEQLRRSEAFLNEGQRLSHTGSWSLKVATGEMNWSAEHYRILGYEVGYEDCEPSLEKFWARVHPDDQSRVRKAFDQAILNKSDVEGSLRLILPDSILPDASTRLIQIIGHSVIGPSGDVVEFVGTSVDVTERKRSEDALREAQAKLAHVARVAGMGELTASIAHEVSQPLTGVIVNATAGQRWLQADPPNIPKARENLERVVRDGERASAIVARVRAFFKKSPYRADELDINVTIEEILDLMASELRGKDISLETHFAQGLPAVVGDRIQLQQVILNLLLNGMDAMSAAKGARVLKIASRIEESENAILVTVSDSGPGLDPGAASRLFEPFYTTKPSGMGMGLAISRSIIEAHGGKIRVAANGGVGATFEFTVPIKTERESGE
jgi:PAS domain S-box-containing protein